jgi:hypothetical protein
MSALILGFFASSWFGWAQAEPPSGWVTALNVGSIISVVVAVLGALLAWRSWQDGSALNAPDAMRRYGIIVGIEVAAGALGAVIVTLLNADLVAPWICLVVGVHMWPLASVFEAPALRILAGVLVVVAVLAVVVAGVTDVAASAVTGAGAGLALLVFAGWSAALAARWLSSANSRSGQPGA